MSERREQLRATVSASACPQLQFSDGVVGPGKEFFNQAVEQDLEGMVAKRLDSRYLPGKRCDTWIKVRQSSGMLCAILGYVPKRNDFESLILGSDLAGKLTFVGRVGTGFDQQTREEILELLDRFAAAAPLIECPISGNWVRPGLYCSIRYLELTRDNLLREPVFQKLILSQEDQA